MHKVQSHDLLKAWWSLWNHPVSMDLVALIPTANDPLGKTYEGSRTVPLKELSFSLIIPLAPPPSPPDPDLRVWMYAEVYVMRFDQSPNGEWIKVGTETAEPYTEQREYPYHLTQAQHQWEGVARFQVRTFYKASQLQGVLVFDEGIRVVVP